MTQKKIETAEFRQFQGRYIFFSWSEFFRGPDRIVSRTTLIWTAGRQLRTPALEGIIYNGMALCIDNY